MSIQVATLGFNEDFHKSLSIAFGSRAKNLFALANIADAQIVLVNTDKATDIECRDTSRGGLIPLLAVCGNVDMLGRRRKYFSGIVAKPLQFSELVSTLTQLAGRVPSRETVPISDSGLIEQATRVGRELEKTPTTLATHIRRATDVVETDHYLLGLIYQTSLSKHKKPVFSVTWSGGHWLAIDWERQQVLMSIRKKLVRPFAILPLQDQHLTVTEMSHEELAQLRAPNVYRADLEEFLWSLTFWTARRNRLDILDPEKVYRLKSWPNLTRCSASDADMPLANYWVDRPSSVKALIENTGIAEERILPFAACCLTSGLLAPVDTDANQSKASAPPPSRISKLLSMVLGKIEV